MSSKYIRGIALLLSTLAPLFAKSFSADRFDVRLEVLPGGGLDATERVAFRFEGGPFRYAYRYFDMKEVDRIDILSAAIDGVPCRFGNGPGEVSIERGAKLRVQWNFEPVSNVVRTFTLNYHVDGALRMTGRYPALVWQPIPADRSYMITRSTVTLQLPESASFASEPRMENARIYSVDARTRELRLGSVRAGDRTTLRATFEPGTLAIAIPTWQARTNQRKEQARRDLLTGAGFGGLAAVAGLVILLRYRPHSESVPRPPSDQAWTTPPDDTPPALVGSVAGTSPGFTSLAALLDLARRGYLRVVAEPKSFWGGRKYQAIRLPGPSGSLRPHEQTLLQLLFCDGDSTALTNFASRVGSNREFSETLRRETVLAGWWDEENHRKRTRIVGLSLIAMALGVAMFAFGLVSERTLVAAAGGPIAAVGLIGLILGGLSSPRTPMGEQFFDRWKSYSANLRRMTRNKLPLAPADQFETLLPYATVFGLAAYWTHAYAKRFGLTAPEWFHDPANQGDFAGFVAFTDASSASSGGDGGSGGGGGDGGGGGGSGAG